MKRRVVSVILFFFLVYILQQNLLLAQNSTYEYKLDKHFFVKLGDDFKETLLSPRHWEEKDLLTLSAVISTGVLLYAFDQEIYDWFQDNRTSFPDDVSEVLSAFGHGAFLLGLMTALYTSGEIFENRSLRKTALLSLESFIFSGVLVNVIKFTTGRARPQTGKSKSTFDPFSSKSSYYAFPSGHACAAFAVATTIAEQSEKTYVDVISYSLASMVALSRIHRSKHWSSDVFIGSALGYFIAKKISGLNRDQNSRSINVGFHLSRERQTISLSFSF